MGNTQDIIVVIVQAVLAVSILYFVGKDDMK